MILASRAERDPTTNQYTDRASKALEDVAGCIRLFNVLVWASFSKKFGILLTPKGLSRMLSRNVMTMAQYKCFISVHPSICGPQHTALQWIYIRAVKGMEEGAFPQTDALEKICLTKILELRSTMASIGDCLAGKIPLAYAQFVQLMVDIFLILSPFALYPDIGLWWYVYRLHIYIYIYINHCACVCVYYRFLMLFDCFYFYNLQFYSVPGVGLLTLFYGGMLDLSKILLFPLNEDSFYKDNSVNMDIGVLMRESNVGSNRWHSGVETLPF